MGLDLAVEAVAKLKHKIPGIQFHLYGEHNGVSGQDPGLGPAIEPGRCYSFHGFKSLREIAQDILKRTWDRAEPLDRIHRRSIFLHEF